MNGRSRTFLAAILAVLLASAVVFAVSTFDSLRGLGLRSPEESKPAEESKPPAAPHVPAYIGPGEEGPGSAEPSYSPDGREVAFLTLWRGAQLDIWIASTLSGRLRPLAADPKVDEREPAWSPTGSLIAFTSNKAGGGIWLIRPDGSGLIQLTSGPDSQPAWSPDGTQIAFVSNRAGPGSRSIWVINADGSGLRRLTNRPCCQNYPSFSPDGGRIVFSQSVFVKVGAGGRYVGDNLWVMNADGTGLRQLTTGVFRDTSPNWGVRGVLFRSDRIQPNRTRPGAIWMVQPDGSGLQAIPNAIGADPRWSPDGTRFAFSSSGIAEFDFRSGMIRPVVQIKGHFFSIDIVPGETPNIINLRTDPKVTAPIRVAILSRPGFNPVQRVNQASIRFGRTGSERSLSFCTADEVNGDGVPDLICHFEIQPTGFRPGDTEGILRFMSTDRSWFEGRDTVQVIP